MSKPIVAVVGRPNVGKSTFFNSIVGRRVSIVEDTPGVTRDQLVVIGDTPHDITCAQAIGVRSLIVLKGSAYAPDRLEAYHPWKIIPELPEDPRDLNAILEED